MSNEWCDKLVNNLSRLLIMKRILLSVLFIVFCLTAFVGCMKWDYGEMEDFSATGDGLFITNEGNFQYGNATLSYYDPETKTVENEVFYRD